MLKMSRLVRGPLLSLSLSLSQRFFSQNEGWSIGVVHGLGPPVHEGVHGPGPQGWSMNLGSMFCICPLYYEFTDKSIRNQKTKNSNEQSLISFFSTFEGLSSEMLSTK